MSHEGKSSYTPWNEWLCLALCRALGVEPANAEVLIFDGKPVIVVERFDRVWRDGVLYRLPQEDICQALSVPPTRKFQSDGGPGIKDILEFLNGAVAPHEDRLAFMKAQIVFWLLAAIDGHALPAEDSGRNDLKTCSILRFIQAVPNDGKTQPPIVA